MAKEIERKFLIDINKWPTNQKGILYQQGYLAITEKGIIRIRIKAELSTLTVKSKGTGISRDEFEYEIPIDEAKNLLELCQNDIIIKTRYKVMCNNKLWDVDEFHGKNKGLWIAEIELKTEDEKFEQPDWIKKEVTGNKNYYNAFLSMYPFLSWKNE